jgi:hypothetical protein
LLLGITALAVTGIFIGGLIGRKLSGDKLRKAFGWFVLSMAIAVLIKEFFFSF